MTTKNVQMKPQSGAHVVVKKLQQRGVEYVFGVPGAKIDKVSIGSSIPGLRRWCAGMSRTPLLAALVSLSMDIMAAPAECDLLVPPGISWRRSGRERCDQGSCRLINQAERPVVLLGLLASKPHNAVAVQELIDGEARSIGLMPPTTG